jgi:hypothetical protein
MTRNVLAMVAAMAALMVSVAATASEPPLVPEAIGEVSFPHELHTEDLEIECAECHHEINADVLEFPHEDYFEDFWIDCRVCHRPDGEPATARNCTHCHHQAPADVADQTLSAKVVIHTRCWNCHEVGAGATASQTCGDCHQSLPSSAVDSVEGEGDGS